MDTDALDIRHEETGHRGRYFVAMPDGSEARLSYVRNSADHIIAESTFVPPAWRGRQIAERMVARLIADSRAAGQKITPTCWFVADEFARHSPEWDDLRKH